MTKHVTASELTPIYAELVRELSEPDTGDWGLSAPPEFAAELANAAFAGQGPGSEDEHSADTAKTTVKRTNKPGRRNRRAGTKSPASSTRGNSRSPKRG
jgi:hypothetical protein